MRFRLKLRIPRISQHELFLFLLLIPFFKLLSIGSFQDQNFHKAFFKIIGYIYDGGRILAGTYGFYLLIKTKCKGISSIAKGFVFFFLVELLSCIANHSLDLFIIIKIYAYIGFVMLLDYYFSRRGNELLIAIRSLFGILSTIAVITTMLFPLGFLHGDRVYEAVYFLGGKNASFPFYYAFLFSWFFLYTITERKYKLPQVWLLPILLMILAAFICKSVNSMVALILVIGVSVLYLSVKPRINAFLPVTILFILLLIIYIGVNVPAIENLLAILGRNSTFSNRTIIWKQAFEYISKSPVVGSGYQLEYNLGTIVTDHAHSTYLDMLAKYGAVSLASFIYLIYVTIRKTSRINYRPLKCYLGLFLLIYLFHMGFDDYNFNFEILIIMMVNYVSSQARDDYSTTIMI